MLGFEEELLKAVPWQALEDFGGMTLVHQQALEVDAQSAGHVSFVATLGLDARPGHPPGMMEVSIPCVRIECPSQLSVFSCRFERPSVCSADSAQVEFRTQRHVQLFRRLQAQWQCYDAYARLTFANSLR